MMAWMTKMRAMTGEDGPTDGGDDERRDDGDVRGAGAGEISVRVDQGRAMAGEGGARRGGGGGARAAARARAAATSFGGCF